VVDGGGLENHCTRKGTGGSNPSLSASLRSRALPPKRELRLGKPAEGCRAVARAACEDGPLAHVILWRTSRTNRPSHAASPLRARFVWARPRRPGHGSERMTREVCRAVARPACDGGWAVQSERLHVFDQIPLLLIRQSKVEQLVVMVHHVQQRLEAPVVEESTLFDRTHPDRLT
jgi:hypothetical protein